MGNSSTNTNLLTKNWHKVSPNILRNTITDELINQSQAKFKTLDQQQYQISLLRKRANSNHPNIVKLIYFNSYSQSHICSINNRPFGVHIYTENVGYSLKEYLKLAKDKVESHQCLCMSIVSGINFLFEKYGSFSINQKMITVNLKLGKKGQICKKVGKVWINSQISKSQRQFPCNQKQMCKSIIQLLKEVNSENNCRKIFLSSNILAIKNVGELHNIFSMYHNKKESNYQFLSNPSLNSNYQRTKTNSALCNYTKSSTPRQFNMSTKNQKQIRCKSDYIKNKDPKQRQKFIEKEAIFVPSHKRQNKEKVVFNYHEQTQGSFFNNSFTHNKQKKNNIKVNFSFTDSQKREKMIPQKQDYKTPQRKYTQNFQYITKSPPITNFSPQIQYVNERKNKFNNYSKKISHNQPNNIEKNPIELKHIYIESPFINKNSLNLEKSRSLSPKEISMNQSLRDQVHEFQTVEKVSKKENDRLEQTRQNTLKKEKHFKEGQISFVNISPINQNQDSKGNTSKQSIKNLVQNNRLDFFSDRSQKQGSKKNFLNYMKKFEQVRKINKSEHTDRSQKQLPKFLEQKFSIQSSQKNFRKDSADTASKQPKISLDMLKKKSIHSIQQDNPSNGRKESIMDSRQIKINNLELITFKRITERQKNREQENLLKKEIASEKQVIKNQMENLFMGGNKVDDQISIKEKVKQKKATFAELKAEASKILEDFGF